MVEFVALNVLYLEGHRFWMSNSFPLGRKENIGSEDQTLRKFGEKAM